MKLFCPALLTGKYFPTRFMHRSVPSGRNFSPPVLWSDAPDGTQSFTLSVSDLDAGDEPVVLWFVADIGAHAREIRERASGVRDNLPEKCTELRNALGEFVYTGPAIMRDGGPHRILFQLWAIRVPTLSLGPFTPFDERLAAVRASMIEEARLVALATRNS